MEKKISPALLSPVQVGDLHLKNRVALAPLTRSRAGAERIPNELMATYYVQRASAGLLITEATVISEEAIGWADSPGIYNEDQTRGWENITSSVHDAGSVIFLQLWHQGRSSHSSFRKDGSLGVAPSPIKINEVYIHTPIGKQPHETPRALETHEIPRVVEDYRRAAARAKEAGFDGVEIHAANGYLIDQFLQSKTNQRSDQYGGNVENRFRFLKEIVKALLTVWPANRIGVRISPNGNYNDMGSPDYRETFLHIAKELNKYALAYLHVVDGLGFGFHKLGTPMTLSEFRKVFKGPLIGNCGYTQETAEAAIRNGNADLIAFGRPYISNPDLVERFANGWPLSPAQDMSTWYANTPMGYADYPTYHEEIHSGFQDAVMAGK